MIVYSISIFIFPKNVEYTTKKIFQISGKVRVTIKKSYNLILLLLVFQ